MANIYMVTRGNGAVDANMFEKAIQDHLSNLPEERRKAPDGFSTEFKFNYITKDDNNYSLLNPFSDRIPVHKIGN